MKKKILIIFFLFLNTEKLVAEINNSVIITVGNYPITRLDLVKEMKLISLLSNIDININNKKEIKDLAIKTLVKRTIKKSEIERLQVDKYNRKDLERQVSAIASNLGYDKNGFKIFLKNNDLNYDDLIKSFEVDLKWNTAIFKIYKSRISLNTIEIEDRINSELKNMKTEKSILLSEIQVNLSAEGFVYTTNKVFEKIKEIGFEDAARKISISNTAKNGGSLGWIQRDKVSKKIIENIKDLKKGEIGKPILLGDTVVFIKKVDEKGGSVDLEVIKKNIVTQEKNKKLEMFSNSHYSDLEKRINVKFL